MSLSIAYMRACADLRLHMTGKKERYSGVEHGVEDLVEKSKVDIVVQRHAPHCMALWPCALRWVPAVNKACLFKCCWATNLSGPCFTESEKIQQPSLQC